MSQRTDETATSLVASLAEFPGELRRLLEGYPEDALRRPSRDGQWGVLENLCHLRDWESVFFDRARAIAEVDRPDLPAFDDSLWEIEHAYAQQEPWMVIGEFADLRRDLVEVLTRVGVERWNREGVHAIRGPVSLRWLADYLLEHDRNYLDQIKEALH